MKIIDNYNDTFFGLLFIFLIVAILFFIYYIFESFSLRKLAIVSNSDDLFLCFVPFFRNYVLATIIKNNVKNKFVFKYIEYLFLLYPLFLLFGIFGIFGFALFFVYMSFCKILLIKQIDNKWYNYLFLFIFPIIAYNNCFKSICSKDF